MHDGEVVSLQVQLRRFFARKTPMQFHHFSVSTPGVLPRIVFDKNKDGISLKLPADIRDLTGERHALRLRQLGRKADVEIKLVVE